MSSYHMSLSLQISVQLADFGEEPPENIFFWISFFLVANVRVSASKPMVSVLTGNPGSTIQNCPCRIRSRIHRGEGNPIFYHFLRKITKWYCVGKNRHFKSMHSVRMHTVHSNSRLPRGVSTRGVFAPVHAGIHLPPVNRMTDRQV